MGDDAHHPDSSDLRPAAQSRTGITAGSVHDATVFVMPLS